MISLVLASTSQPSLPLYLGSALVEFEGKLLEYRVVESSGKPGSRT